MNRQLLVCATLASFIAIPSQSEQRIEQCPEQLVNFWNQFGKEKDYKNMPGFLVINNCVSIDKREKTIQFYLTAQKRFDTPDDESLVDQLYTDLNWNQ